jgi:hypothetical protein
VNGSFLFRFFALSPLLRSSFRIAASSLRIAEASGEAKKRRHRSHTLRVSEQSKGAKRRRKKREGEVKKWRSREGAMKRNKAKEWFAPPLAEKQKKLKLFDFI